MSMESELETQYDAAVRDWEAAKQASEAAKKERDEKRELAMQQRDGSRERHLVCAEFWKANIGFLQKCEQEYAAECEKCEIAVDLMIHCHGVDSKAAQIAKHRFELARTKGMKWVGVQYLMNWENLRSKFWLLYWQLKAAECDAAADEIDTAINEFCNRISDESNGKAFNEARTAAEAALDEWENNDDRTDWDAAKPKYDGELEKWNAFKPKGDEYAKEMESKINEYFIKDPTIQLINEMAEAQIQKLQGQSEEEDQDIAEIRKCLEEMGRDIAELKESLAEQNKEIAELKETTAEQNKEIAELKESLAEQNEEIAELKEATAQQDKEIAELKEITAQQEKEIAELKEATAQQKKDISELKNDSEQYKKDISELNNDAEQKRRRTRRLEDGGEKKGEETRGVKSGKKHNGKTKCEPKGTMGKMGKMTECMNSLVQGMQTLMKGQCQYFAESEATARTAVEQEWQLWCEHMMAEIRTLQESEAAARHQQL